MSVRWQWLDDNPNLTGGCLCYAVNNPDQPKRGGWVNPGREFDDLGYQSPHVFKCCGCINFPKDEPPADAAGVDHERQLDLEDLVTEVVPDGKDAPEDS